MTDTDEAQRVAERLTMTERRGLRAAYQQWHDDDALFLPAWRDRGKLAASLHAAGLVTIVLRGAMLNERGLAVRRILTDQPNPTGESA